MATKAAPKPAVIMTTAEYEVATATAEGEPTFEKLSTALAAADAKARSASADAGQARAERSTVAVSAIKAAYSEKLSDTVTRKTLLAAGVLKGTVSKIVTVLSALQDGVISPADVKSLNGAYSLVKSVRAASTSAGATSGSVAVPGVATAAPGHIVTPKEALQVIVNVIVGEKDADKAFKLGGEWITKVTNAITAALKKKADGADEEDE